MLLQFRKKKSVSIELAPLIDIAFILLIFFAVSSSLISKNQTIPLDLPTAVSTEKKSPDLIISIEQNKTIHVDKQAIDFNQLIPVISSALKEDPSTQIILNADKQIDYGFIVLILDQIRIAGSGNIALQVEKKVFK